MREGVVMSRGRCHRPTGSHKWRHWARQGSWKLESAEPRDNCTEQSTMWYSQGTRLYM